MSQSLGFPAAAPTSKPQDMIWWGTGNPARGLKALPGVQRLGWVGSPSPPTVSKSLSVVWGLPAWRLGGSCTCLGPASQEQPHLPGSCSQKSSSGPSVASPTEAVTQACGVWVTGQPVAPPMRGLGGVLGARGPGTIALATALVKGLSSGPALGLTGDKPGFLSTVPRPP